MTAAYSFLLFALFVCCRCECESNYPFNLYPWIHLGPLILPETKVGWMNDPNGFCYYKGEYHLFYQFNPYSSVEPGIAHWGHAKSPDLVSWEHLPIALYPNASFDSSGVFSGSALVEDDIMYLFYTGNVNHPGQTPDHEQHQIVVTSNNGEDFVKLEINPIIDGANYQPNFRDPKVWKTDETYYMVVGNSFNKTLPGNSFNNTMLGRILLYTSKDKYNWIQAAILGESDGSLGYMWECPDFFKLGDKYVLMFSPQGVEPQGDKYKNLYQTGYIVGNFNTETNDYTETNSFRELDHGHDFYATQTILNKKDQRICIAWFDMWDENYLEGQDGFTGQMTLPRILELTPDGRLLQKPVPEIEQAVGRKLYSGKAQSGTKVKLTNNVAKIEVRTSKEEDFTLVIESECANGTVTISYDCKNGRITLDRGGDDGVRRTTYRPSIEGLHIDLYIDRSSVELFTEDGEITFSSRFFIEGQFTVRVAEGSCARILNVFEMMRTVSHPNPY